MNELFAFEILHSRSDLCGHIDKNWEFHFRFFVLFSEVFEKRSVTHVFGDNVDGLLL